MIPIKISVIIPVFNAEKHLEECLKSVASQTFVNIEIICVNDGSTDASLEIMENFSNFDERIKIINRKNQGQGSARNEGLKVAKGDYVTFVDSDDKIEKTFLEKTYESANSNNADICYCAYYVYYQSQNRPKFSNPKYRLDALKKYPHPFDFETLNQDVFKINFEVWSKLYKRDFLQKNNILVANTKLAEDVSFFCKCIFSAKKITAVFDQLYCYRKNVKSSLSENAALHMASLFESLKDVEDYVTSLKNYEKIKYSYYSAKLDIYDYWLYKIDKNSKEKFFNLIKKDIAQMQNLEREKLRNGALLTSYLNDDYKTYEKKFTKGVFNLLRRIF